MSTRSITHIYELPEGESVPSVIKTTPLVSLYVQCDGYPSGMGSNLAAFLKPITVINGISGQEAGTAANGAGCLAAQLIAHLKDGIGNVYVYPAGSKDCGEDYVYQIVAGLSGITLIVNDVTYPNGYDKEPVLAPLFQGPPAAFEAWLEEYEKSRA